MRKWLPRAYGTHHNTASTARNGKNPTREFRRINPGLILLKPSHMVVIIYYYIGYKYEATIWYLTGFPNGSNLGSTV